MVLPIILILIIVLYLVLASIGCKALAVSAYPFLANKHGGGNVQIAACGIEGKDYGHAYLIVNGKPYEPRFLGLWTLSHIDYDNPTHVWDTAQDFLIDYNVIPFK